MYFYNEEDEQECKAYYMNMVTLLAEQLAWLLARSKFIGQFLK